MALVTETEDRAAIEKPYPIIDCDTHPILNSTDQLAPYLSTAWQKRLNIGAGKLSAGQFAYQLPRSAYFNPHGGFRTDTLPESGGIPGSDRTLMAKQLFEDHGIDYAVLICTNAMFVGAVPNPDIATVLMTAINDWIVEQWLPYDRRFLGIIHVASHDPKRAADEIRRLAGNPQMKAVFVPTIPMRLGKPHYDPIFDAAQEAGLPIVWHPGSDEAGQNGGHNHPVSPPSTYVESYTMLPCIAMAQFTSLITEGTFEKFPRLKVGLVEGGVCWVIEALWRLHRAWVANRDEIPWVKRPPAEYAREHIRISTQPMEEPPGDVRDVFKALDTVGADELLMYASDYPHWDFDNPRMALRAFPPDWQRKIMYDNPRDFFNLPTN